MAASDVIDVEREKVKKVFGDHRKTRSKFFTRMHHQIGENWFSSNVCAWKLRQIEITCINQSYSWDFTLGTWLVLLIWRAAVRCSITHLSFQSVIKRHRRKQEVISGLFQLIFHTKQHRHWRQQQKTFHFSRPFLWFVLSWSYELTQPPPHESKKSFMTQRKICAAKVFFMVPERRLSYHKEESL